MAGRRDSALIAALLVALTASGCSPAAPTPTTAPPAAQQARPSFPAVPGTALEESQGDGVWSLKVRVDDAEAGYREARRRLIDAGFQLTKDREGTGGGDGQACTRSLCVGFSATEDPGSGRRTVAYEVFRPIGITTDG